MGTVVLSAPLVMGVILYFCVHRHASPKTVAFFGTLFGIAIAASTLGGIGRMFNDGIVDFTNEGVTAINEQVSGGGAGGAAAAPK